MTTKHCPACNMEIDAAATNCPGCNAPQDAPDQPEPIRHVTDDQPYEIVGNPRPWNWYPALLFRPADTSIKLVFTTEAGYETAFCTEISTNSWSCDTEDRQVIAWCEISHPEHQLGAEVLSAREVELE